MRRLVCFREKLLMMKNEIFRWIGLALIVLLYLYLFTGILPWWVLAAVDGAAIVLVIWKGIMLRRAGATDEAKRQFRSAVRLLILLTILITIPLFIPPGHGK